EPRSRGPDLIREIRIPGRDLIQHAGFIDERRVGSSGAGQFLLSVDRLRLGRGGGDEIDPEPERDNGADRPTRLLQQHRAPPYYRWSHCSMAPRRLSQAPSSSFSIRTRIALGFTIEPMRLTALPSRSIRNLVKFHLIALVPRKPRRSPFSQR